MSSRRVRLLFFCYSIRASLSTDIAGCSDGIDEGVEYPKRKCGRVAKLGRTTLLHHLDRVIRRYIIVILYVTLLSYLHVVANILQKYFLYCTILLGTTLMQLRLF